MILSFQEDFVPKIKARTKIQTIREDPTKRWKIGGKIHFWKNSPFIVSKNPYQFAGGFVYDVNGIMINPHKDRIVITQPLDFFSIRIQEELDAFAVSDGFDDWGQMKEFFTERFEGSLITWDQNTLKFL